VYVYHGCGLRVVVTVYTHGCYGYFAHLRFTHVITDLRILVPVILRTPPDGYVHVLLRLVGLLRSLLRILLLRLTHALVAHWLPLPFVHTRCFGCSLPRVRQLRCYGSCCYRLRLRLHCTRLRHVTVILLRLPVRRAALLRYRVRCTFTAARLFITVTHVTGSVYVTLIAVAGLRFACAVDYTRLRLFTVTFVVLRLRCCCCTWLLGLVYVVGTVCRICSLFPICRCYTLFCVWLHVHACIVPVPTALLPRVGYAPLFDHRVDYVTFLCSCGCLLLRFTVYCCVAHTTHARFPLYAFPRFVYRTFVLRMYDILRVLY